MLLSWLNRLRAPSPEEGRRLYIEEALRPRLDIASATPARVDTVPSPDSGVRLAMDFGRGRVFWVSFFPRQKIRQPARERAALMQSLGQRGIPVPELVFADYSDETHKKFGLEVVVEKALDCLPFEAEWTGEHLAELAGLLKRVHAVIHQIRGAPWRGNGAHRDPVRDYSQRWQSALGVVEAFLDRRVEPNREASFRERALARIEAPGRYELVHGAICSTGVGRLNSGGVIPLAFDAFHFGCRETDLLAASIEVCGGSPDKTASFLSRYLDGMPDAVRRRHEALHPFYLALSRLERGAAVAREAAADQAAPKPAAKRVPKEARIRTAPSNPARAAVLEHWQAFLCAADLPEAPKPRAKAVRKPSR